MSKPNSTHNKNANNNSAAKEQDTDDKIAALYQSRKSRNLSPQETKRVMLNSLATAQRIKQPWWRINLRSYLQMSAVCVTAALVLVVISLQAIDQSPHASKNHSLTILDYKSVEYHELASRSKILAQANKPNSLPNESTTSSAQRHVQYQQAQSIYVAKQATLAVHKLRYATVVQSEDGLSLLTCDKQLLELSQQVVDVLFDNNSTPTIDFSKGNMLALSFDDNGHIIDITKEEQKKQC